MSAVPTHSPGWLTRSNVADFLLTGASGAVTCLVRNEARRHCPDEHSREDVVQVVLAKLWKSRDVAVAMAPGQVANWLKTTTRNEAMSFWRKTLGEASAVEAMAERGLDRDVIDRDVKTHVLHQRVLDCLSGRASCLNNLEREVLSLVGQGVEPLDIASRTRSRPSTVRSVIARGRAKLRRLLEREQLLLIRKALE